MAAAEEDWLVTFLHQFSSMSSSERDAALDALPADSRNAIVALAEQRAATADTHLIDVLDAGQAGLDKLYEVTRPADLFTVIRLAVREQPGIVVEALFAAVVLHRGWDESGPAAIMAMREQWHWHVYERIKAAHEGEGRRAGDEQPG